MTTDTELMLALIRAVEIDPYHDGGQVAQAIHDIEQRLRDEGYLD